MSGSSEAPTAVAELREATVRYDGVTALDGIGFRLESGCVTALLGPNGAGKTTAIRLLLGLHAPDRGSVHVLGLDPREPAARQQVGAMLQIAKVPETLRVREHIDTFRSYYERPLTAGELIERAGLHGLERRLFGTLSGGEKQRVMLALALVGNPRLLFLDEPTAGLDVEARRALWDGVRRLRADGRAVLLTTHYLEEADALADRIIVLDRGRVIADGSPAAIRATVPARRITCVTSCDAGGIRALPGVDHVELSGGTTVILTAVPERVVADLLAADPALHELTVGAVPLEDAFVALTRGSRTEVAA